MSASSASARVTRESGTSFYYAFRILPREKRDAIYALYSFCRKVDDCVDEADGEGEPGLQAWLTEVDRCYAGTPTTELGRDLTTALLRFPIPRACFLNIVEGCRMDLTTARYHTFAELRVYCERVASAVGLATIEIFGYRDPATRLYAVELGLALQLTNILRDVGVDAGRGRIYLPAEDLARFSVSEAELLAAAQPSGAPRSPGLRALLEFSAERARSHYAAAQKALPAADRRSMASAQVMGGVYRALLDEMVSRGFPWEPLVRVPRRRKILIALTTLLRTRFA